MSNVVASLKVTLLHFRKPILTLPPVETSVVHVHFSPAEREFYNSLLLKSQDVFDGYLRAGTASKSWLAIFSLLHRLRQACDHVALTVKSHMDASDWIGSRPQAELKEEKEATSPSSDVVSDEVSLSVGPCPIFAESTNVLTRSRSF